MHRINCTVTSSIQDRSDANNTLVILLISVKHNIGNAILNVPSHLAPFVVIPFDCNLDSQQSCYCHPSASKSCWLNSLSRTLLNVSLSFWLNHLDFIYHHIQLNHDPQVGIKIKKYRCGFFDVPATIIITH